MQLTSIICFILFWKCINAKDPYLGIRNNFLNFFLRLENYHVKKIFHNIGKYIDNSHYKSIGTLSNISCKYNTLSYEEQELLQAINFFI